MKDLIHQETVQITIDSNTVLEGNLTIPSNAKGVVLFAHGSGSSRHSPRNQYVASVLNDAHLTTLLIDLLTAEEEAIDQRTRHLRFDIDLLAARLSKAIDWMTQQQATRSLNIGLFGASTGAGAALLAASMRVSLVSAVVSRGGRPDLAGEALQHVEAATLLIVGGDDVPVIKLNQQALRQLHSTSQLEIVAGATHLFEEPGTLAEVAQLASDWFRTYLEDEA